ncbi:MAG: hypothetical protein ACAI35_17010 [Candidatus Methylacidiphilales bacterium]
MKTPLSEHIRQAIAVLAVATALLVIGYLVTKHKSDSIFTKITSKLGPVDSKDFVPTPAFAPHASTNEAATGAAKRP